MTGRTPRKFKRNLSEPNWIALRSIAGALSYILHPVVMMLATAVILSGLSRASARLVLLDAALLLTGLFPGMAFIIVKTRRGEFGHFHLLDKTERRLALPLLLGGLAVSALLYPLTDPPASLMRGVLLGIWAGAGAVLISFFWKISLHAAVAMGCAALLQPVSPALAGCFLALGAIVGVSRLYAGHHTSLEVAAGWLYGFGAVLALRASLGW